MEQGWIKLPMTTLWTIQTIGDVRIENDNKVADVVIINDMDEKLSYQIIQTSNDIIYLMNKSGESIIVLEGLEDIGTIASGSSITVSVSVK